MPLVWRSVTLTPDEAEALYRSLCIYVTFVHDARASKTAEPEDVAGWDRERQAAEAMLRRLRAARDGA